MKKIRKIIISFGIIIMGFAKKVLADMPDIPDGKVGETSYGVRTSIYNAFLGAYDVLVFFLVPIIFLVGFFKRRSFEKRIDSLNKELLDAEKEDAKKSCIGNVSFTCLIIIIQYVLWFLRYLEDKQYDNNNVFEKICLDYLDAPVMISLSLVLLLVIIFMTKSKDFEASYKKIMLNISSICMIINIIMGAILLFVGIISSLNMIVLIMLIENIFVSIQTSQYKTKLIDERIKEVEHEQN